jgi:hypothetical protein
LIQNISIAKVIWNLANPPVKLNLKDFEELGKFGSQ